LDLREAYVWLKAITVQSLKTIPGAHSVYHVELYKSQWFDSFFRLLFVRVFLQVNGKTELKISQLLPQFDSGHAKSA
jgi:hypothetical protein